MHTQKTAIDADAAAEGFAAVGSVPRLRIISLLVAAGPDGTTASEMSKRLRMPLTTLSHHLRQLALGNMIEQKKSGRKLITTANYDFVEQLAAYLLKNCCADAKGCVAPEASDCCAASCPAPSADA